jgi:hypothetical protein
MCVLLSRSRPLLSMSSSSLLLLLPSAATVASTHLTTPPTAFGHCASRGRASGSFKHLLARCRGFGTCTPGGRARLRSRSRLGPARLVSRPAGSPNSQPPSVSCAPKRRRHDRARSVARPALSTTGSGRFPRCVALFLARKHH